MWKGRAVVLASASPRRAELLRRVIEEFEVLVPDVDEEGLTVRNPYVTAEHLAIAKAEMVLRLRPDALIIAGDTVVAIPQPDGFKLLGKPQSFDQAVAMLMMLSGRTHLVVTGLAVHSAHGKESGFEESWVTFRSIAAAEAEDYVATGEPMDKAGGYAIQGGAKTFVASLEGDVTSVIGLPITLLKQLLLRLSG